jgi:hypothetical protein
MACHTKIFPMKKTTEELKMSDLNAGKYCGECHRMKIIGKPYSGKPNVRFDEGELEIELLATTPALYSTEVRRRFSECFFLKSINHPLLHTVQISTRYLQLGQSAGIGKISGG